MSEVGLPNGNATPTSGVSPLVFGLTLALFVLVFVPESALGVRNLAHNLLVPVVAAGLMLVAPGWLADTIGAWLVVAGTLLPWRCTFGFMGTCISGVTSLFVDSSVTYEDVGLPLLCLVILLLLLRARPDPFGIHVSTYEVVTRGLVLLGAFFVLDSVVRNVLLWRGEALFIPSTIVGRGPSVLWTGALVLAGGGWRRVRPTGSVGIALIALVIVATPLLLRIRYDIG